MEAVEHKLTRAVQELVAGSQNKQRKFTETVELQVSLQDYSPVIDKRFNGKLILPHEARPYLNVCLFGTYQHCIEASELCIDSYSTTDLKFYNRNKKTIKKLISAYDVSIASAEIIRQIPRLLGPCLSKVGKFPSIINESETVEEVLYKLKRTISFQLKKVSILNIAVGHVLLSPTQLIENISLAIEFLITLLKDGWGNISTIHIKSTMGKPQRIYSS